MNTNLFPVIFYFYLSFTTSSFILASPVVLWPHIYIKNYFLLFLCHTKVSSHFVNFQSIPIWSTSHFANSHFVNSHLVNVDEVRMDKVGIDKVGSWQSGNWLSIKKNCVMLSIWTRYWDAVDCVMDVLAIMHSMYCEELMNNCGLALKVLSI